MAEVLSCIEVGLPNWTVRHLSIWSEIVQPIALEPLVVADVEEMEETTMDAQYQELRSKIACLNMVYQHFLVPSKNIQHVWFL